MKTAKEFKKYVEQIKKQDFYKEPLAFGITRVDVGQLNRDKVLQANYPIINWKENYGSGAVFLDALYNENKNINLSKSELIVNINNSFLDFVISKFAPFINEAKGDEHKNIQTILHLKNLQENHKININDYRIVFLFADEPCKSVESVYLKLYALSLNKAKLRSLNLNGAFGILHNCAWSDNVPIELEWLRQNEIELKLQGSYPNITMVDKFPRFLSHIIPSENTRILDSAKVRFGAKISDGTTVMPGASYINFNAGTLGVSMVEGRISSSAVVGKGSDVGGGASILGVLSGTDGDAISVGENCLLGANSCLGIPIGDGCILDAGITILPGTKIALDDMSIKNLKKVNKNIKFTNIMKGLELININGAHFRINSQNGQCVVKKSTREVKLNKNLH
jgi:2,3,4,5-tetrahydropyridine-2-carboxylate N-succinyltransferase